MLLRRPAAPAVLVLSALLLSGCGGAEPGPAVVPAAAVVQQAPAALAFTDEGVEGVEAAAPPAEQERAARTSAGRTPATAAAVVPDTPAPRRTSAQERGEAALAALRFPWRELGYTVRFAPYTGGTLGLASARTRTITVYVKPGQDEVELRTTIAHELGHALDHVHGTAARRAEYRRIRGLSSSTDWYPCERCTDFASPAGDWAEVFAASLVGAGDFRSRLGPPPSREQLRRLAPLFAVPPRRAAGPRPQPQPAAPSPSPSPTGGSLLPPLLA